MGWAWEGNVGNGAVDQDREAEGTEGLQNLAGGGAPLLPEDMGTPMLCSFSPGNVGASSLLSVTAKPGDEVPNLWFSRGGS